MSVLPYAVSLFVWRGVRHAVRLMRRGRFGACGAHARFDPFGSYLPPEKMFFGARSFIGPGARISADEGFYLGETAKIGPELCVMGGTTTCVWSEEHRAGCLPTASIFRCAWSEAHGWEHGSRSSRESVSGRARLSGRAQ